MPPRRLPYKLNWKRDKPDWRDRKMMISPTLAVLPRQMDLRPLCPPVVDQGAIGSCTANALAGLLGYLEVRQLADGLNQEPFELAKVYTPFSRLFIYYNERALEGDPGEDGGAELRDGIKTMAKLGACSEETWPYGQTFLFEKPAVYAYTEALSHRITGYTRLQSLDHVRGVVSTGFPVAFGFTCYESLEEPEVAATGILPMPGPDESPIGGHAVVAVGYDDDTERLLVRNSWGTGWGIQGYFWMPYDYFKMLASDFWWIEK